MLGALRTIMDAFNVGRDDGVRVSLADLIVPGGCSAVEQAAEAAGTPVQVPFTPGRMDTTAELTDEDSFEWLRPRMDGFRNYAEPGYAVGVSAEQLFLDRAALLGLSALEWTALVGGLRVLDTNWDDARHGVFTDRLGVLTIVARLVFGWPLYLMLGLTGGPERGVTNHFVAGRPFSTALFPRRLRARVFISALGVATTLVLLAFWAFTVGSLVPVLVLYVGPYLVMNAWVVSYTWLQHTSADVPHYEGDDWTYVRGAFCSVDRPYGWFLNLVHHRIGSTHVAHHLDAWAPHYRAAKATKALADAFPQMYRYDPTPVAVALWRAARDCHVVAPSDDGWRFTSPNQP